MGIGIYPGMNKESITQQIGMIENFFAHSSTDPVRSSQAFREETIPKLVELHHFDRFFSRYDLNRNGKLDKWEIQLMPAVQAVICAEILREVNKLGPLIKKSQ